MLGSWNPLFYGAPIENIVWAHQSEYYAAIRAVEEHDMDIAPFIEFMLDKILRTLKAKGEAYEVGKESRVKSRDKVLCLYTAEHKKHRGRLQLTCQFFWIYNNH